MQKTTGFRCPPCWRSLVRLGGALLVCLTAACVRQEVRSPFPAFSQYAGREVSRLTLTGDLRVPADSIRAAIRTRPSRCRFLFLPICIPFTSIGREEYRLDLTELEQDVTRIQLFYRDRGFYSARVTPDVEATDNDQVRVTLDIDAGRPVVLTKLQVEGADSIVSSEQLMAAMPLEVGEPFGRSDFLASADTIRARMLQNGHLYAEVLRNFDLDTIADVAVVDFQALPGPVVLVDTILFRGDGRLTESTLRRQLPLSEGDILRETDLMAAQRNLYDLDMVNFAVVQLAPDTLRRSEDLSRATLLVQVVESPQYAVQTNFGFGTVECFRAGGQWANRNFLGGGRRLEARASVSRIGAGAPLDMGLEGRGCAALGQEEFFSVTGVDARDRVDYTAGVSLQQPSIFGTRNRGEVNVDAERVSEPRAFVRESVGGRVSTSRELTTGPTMVTGTLKVNRGRTIASPAILCVGFDTCSQEDFERLTQDRWSNSIAVGVVRDATRTDPVEVRGYILRGNVDWASSLLASDDRYLRVAGEAARYQMVRPGWLFASRVRVGRFIHNGLGSAAGYIPPEMRFFSGGPTSVRGYGRNQLGPASYVQQLFVNADPGEIRGSATGGTQLFEGSLEMRFPSPWLSDLTRLAVFVDAGHVSNPGMDLSRSTGLRVTPGVGIRFLTPVGPFRLDVAYNPYQTEIGPLYSVDPDNGLTLEDPAFRPEQGGFLRRLRFQFALGQAF